MCGIAGLFRTDEVVKDLDIASITNRLMHRGPDGEGVKIFNGAGGIGHRRLSIIDLEAGQQPMSNEDDTVWITFNGEIYNYKELKQILLKAGHQFKTNSDTEVVIHAYEEWGLDCINKLRGMFAFAIVDLKKKKTILVRDHLGIKPLFYYSGKGVFSFASELRAISGQTYISKQIDLQSIDKYLWLQYIPAPHTIYKNFYKLQPAHYVIYNFNGTVEEPVQYWDLDLSRKQNKTSGQWQEELDHVLKKSVDAHLVSDVGFGAFLSGGIDSSLIVSYMSKILKQPVKTFSIGFPDKDYNELEYSKQAAAVYKTEHHTQVVEEDSLDILPTLVKHYGEPFGDSSAVPTYFVSKLAAQHVKMVLSGDGADELFAGYSGYQKFMMNQRVSYLRGWRKTMLPFLEGAFPSRYPDTKDFSSWIKFMQILDEEWRTKLWRKEFSPDLNSQRKELTKIYNTGIKQGLSLINRAQYFDIKTYMPFDILSKVDVASMCHSLEVRTPFIDKDVFEFAAAIPWNINLEKGNETSWNGKMLLKKILLKDFTPEFINRKKKGFGIPIVKWFQPGGKYHQQFNDIVLSQSSVIFEYFNREAVLTLQKENNYAAMWMLLFLEEWLRSEKKNFN